MMEIWIRSRGRTFLPAIIKRLVRYQQMGVATRQLHLQHSYRIPVGEKDNKMATNKSSSEGYKSAFHGMFPELVRELTEEELKNGEIADGAQHLKDVS